MRASIPPRLDISTPALLSSESVRQAAIGGIPPDESSAEEQGSSAMLRHSVARHLLLSSRAEVELLSKFPATSVIARSAVLPSITSKSMGRSTANSMTAKAERSCTAPRSKHRLARNLSAGIFFLPVFRQDCSAERSYKGEGRHQYSYTVSVAMLCAKNLGRTGPLNFLCSVRSSAPGKGGSPAQLRIFPLARSLACSPYSHWLAFSLPQR